MSTFPVPKIRKGEGAAIGRAWSWLAASAPDAHGVTLSRNVHSGSVIYYSAFLHGEGAVACVTANGLTPQEAAEAVFAKW